MAPPVNSSARKRRRKQMMNEKRQFKVKTASGYFCLLRSISRLSYVLICPWKPHGPPTTVIAFRYVYFHIHCTLQQFFYNAHFRFGVLQFQRIMLCCNLYCKFGIISSDSLVLTCRGYIPSDWSFLRPLLIN